MSFDQLANPAVAVNGYVWESMKAMEPTLAPIYKNIIPFFPNTDQFSGTAPWENNAYVIYDRTFRTAKGPFHPVKRESIIYSIRGTTAQTTDWSMAIFKILDRQDDAAQDINAWNRRQSTQNGVYLHHVRVSQNGASIPRTFSTQPLNVVELFVDIEYHFTDDYS